LKIFFPENFQSYLSNFSAYNFNIKLHAFFPINEDSGFYNRKIYYKMGYIDVEETLAKFVGKSFKMILL